MDVDRAVIDHAALQLRALDSFPMKEVGRRAIPRTRGAKVALQEAIVSWRLRLRLVTEDERGSWEKTEKEFDQAGARAWEVQAWRRGRHVYEAIYFAGFRLASLTTPRSAGDDDLYPTEEDSHHEQLLQHCQVCFKEHF